MKTIKIQTVVAALFISLIVLTVGSLVIGLITGDLNTNPLK